MRPVMSCASPCANTCPRRSPTLMRWIWSLHWCVTVTVQNLDLKASSYACVLVTSINRMFSCFSRRSSTMPSVVLIAQDMRMDPHRLQRHSDAARRAPSDVLFQKFLDKAVAAATSVADAFVTLNRWAAASTHGNNVRPILPGSCSSARPNRLIVGIRQMVFNLFRWGINPSILKVAMSKPST